MVVICWLVGWLVGLLADIGIGVGILARSALNYIVLWFHMLVRYACEKRFFFSFPFSFSLMHETLVGAYMYRFGKES